ncbi:uncharacterized protein LOC143460275 [Clavelina lepadiformis]|uniref:uncharacterized protein LOC143460275 n=1 Tax=Clavelina lepadiformis TaxID=159417 RepID=UPI0040414EC0
MIHLNTNVLTLLLITVFVHVDGDKWKRCQDENNGLECFDGIIVGETCYRLLYRAGKRTGYSEAESLCSFHGGQLAEIPDGGTYSILFDYIKKAWMIDLDNPERTYVQCWLGSENDNGVVMMRNGKRGFVAWYPGYPRSTSGHVQMAMEVPILPSHLLRNIGMFNINPSHTAIPLCQFSLNA